MATKKIRIACVVDADGSWNAVSWHAASDGPIGQVESNWRDAAWEGDLGLSGVKAFYWIEVELDLPVAEAVGAIIHLHASRFDRCCGESAPRPALPGKFSRSWASKPC